jgi:F0F1-type ATP synthase membrane subunit b/b'
MNTHTTPGHTFNKLIERMEDLILAGTGIPLTPWTVVNADRVVPLLDRIREQLPEELVHAQDIIAMRDELLTDARLRADNMLSDARNKADALVNESDILRTIQHEAACIKADLKSQLDAMKAKAVAEVDSLKLQAYEEARLVKEGAEHYAESILTSLDGSLADVQAVVRNGQSHLHQNRSTASSGGHKRHGQAPQHTTVARQAKAMPPSLKDGFMESMPGVMLHDQETNHYQRVLRPGQKQPLMGGKPAGGGGQRR